MTTTTTTTVDQPAADAVVRLIGLDPIVDSYEFDAERGHVYILDHGCAFIVRQDGTVTLQDEDGNPTLRAYGSTPECERITFAVDGDDVNLYQRGAFIASETIER